MAKLGKDSIVISHWHHPVENLQTSTLEFFSAVEVALRPRQIPDYTVSRVDWREGGVLTARREYLRIKRGRLAFDLCAAPFGTGFFFSWWLAEVPPSHTLLWAILIFTVPFVAYGICVAKFGLVGLLLGPLFIVGVFIAMGLILRDGELGSDAVERVLAIPLIGTLYEKLFKPSTYYRIDTALMFQSVVHAAVLEVVDQVMSAKGARALTELERKPVMREFYQR